MAYVRFSWGPCRVATLIAALAFSASTIAPAEAQELKKVRIGYPLLASLSSPSLLPRTQASAVQTSALVAGEIDYLTGITGPLVAAARGLPFKGIMITHDRPLFWVIANPEIRRVEDLLGKTVAVDRLATLQDIVARDL